MSLEDLTRLMPPHERADTVVDWQSADQAYGVQFPADYRAFMARYGAGSIENFLSVLEPGVSADGGPEGPMVFISDDARAMWDDAPRPEGVDTPADQLLAWGCNNIGDLLCWLAASDVPDDWQVAVYSRGDDAWSVFDCGVVEFLCRNFRAEFATSPLDETALWGNANPRFLTEAEEKRIMATGQDPWPNVAG